jgi:predicted ATPase
VLFSVLYGFWVGNRMALKGDVALGLAAQFLELARIQHATVPLMLGHLLMGISLSLVGDVTEGRAHLDRAIALYDPSEHRPLATRFGHDIRASALAWRALALWMLGYPEAALADVEHALKDAREIGHAATSMFALSHTALALIHCGKQVAASALVGELVALADSKGTVYWKSYGLLLQGWLLAQTGRASEAVSITPAAITAMRSTGATAYAPWYFSYLAKAYAELGQFDDARRCIAEAMTAVETTKERWCESDIHRIAGEIALMSPDAEGASAEAYFERALSVARAQSNVVRTARDHEHGAALARSGQRAAGARSSCARPRPVDRGLGHTRPDRGQSFARHAGAPATIQGAIRRETRTASAALTWRAITWGSAAAPVDADVPR